MWVVEAKIMENCFIYLFINFLYMFVIKNVHSVVPVVPMLSHCQETNPKPIIVGSIHSGSDSSGILKLDGVYSNVSCSVKIVPTDKNTGLIITLRSTRILTGLNITVQYGPIFYRLNTRDPRSYDFQVYNKSKPGENVVFNLSLASGTSVSLTLYYTAYTFDDPCNQFTCKQERPFCISSALKCDQVNNCGNDFDEADCGFLKSLAGRIIGYTFVGVFLLAFVICCIIALILSWNKKGWHSADSLTYQTYDMYSTLPGSGYGTMHQVSTTAVEGTQTQTDFDDIVYSTDEPSQYSEVPLLPTPVTVDEVPLLPTPVTVDEVPLDESLQEATDNVPEVEDSEIVLALPQPVEPSPAEISQPIAQTVAPSPVQPAQPIVKLNEPTTSSLFKKVTLAFRSSSNPDVTGSADKK